MIIKPKNWIDFQHYKDRCPPWIKLHKSILDNYEFQMLPDASKALAMCLWLLASEHLDGEIDADLTKLAFRLRQSVEKIEKALKPLIDYGFFFVVQDASNTIADCKQDAPLDRGETETEIDAPQAASKKKSSRKKSQTTIPENFSISEAVRAWAMANGYSRLEERLNHFILTCKANGYTYSDWDSAFRRAITDDWAKLGKQAKTDSDPSASIKAKYPANTHPSAMSKEDQRELLRLHSKRLAA